MTVKLRRPRRHARGAALLAALPITAAGLHAHTVEPAAAFPVDFTPTCNPTDHISYTFVNPSAFSVNGTAWSVIAEQGIREWNQVMTVNASSGQGVGDQVVNVSPNPGGQVWRVQALPPGAEMLDGSIGVTDCTSRYIYLTTDLSQHGLGPWTPASLRMAASHEMGHALGLGHTGRFDNQMLSGVPSRMTVCAASGGDLSASQFTPEDRAALLDRHLGIRLANPSFEDPASAGLGWGVHDGSLVATSGGAPPNAGTRYAYFLPSNTLSNYAYQRQSIYNWPGTNAIFQYQARKADPAAAGDISSQIWARRYNSSTTGCPQFPTDESPIPGFNANGRSYPYTEGTAYVLRNSDHQAAQSGWSTHQTLASIPKGNHNAVDFQVRVTTNVKSSGAASPIHFDNVRFIS